MARYLTPSKVAHLVLCSMYCSSVVPTSATVPFLSFVVKSLQITPTKSEASNVSPLLSAQDSVREIALALNKHTSSVPGRTLYDLFLSEIWEIDSLDRLHQFFAQLEGILARSTVEARRDAELGNTMPNAEIRLSKTSPMGLFVRKCQLEFTRLQFHDTMNLWTNFMQYKQLTAPAWKQRGHIISFGDVDANLRDFDGTQATILLKFTYPELSGEVDEHVLYSMNDVETLVQFQVEKLQKHGNRVPPAVMKTLQDMLKTSGNVPNLAYFVKFFEAWRAGDYTSAFDNLHRYFDYTMQAREKTYYQYALLHMAILQADFGCYDEAMAAMAETIATARENQDLNCLNFSLSWLGHLRKVSPGTAESSDSIFGSEKQAMVFLKSKAKEGKMWSLLSSVLLGESKLESSQGGNTVRAFEYLYQSIYLTTIHHVDSNAGLLLLMQSAMFARLGIDHLSTAYAQLLLHMNQVEIPLEDKVRAICRVAYATTLRGMYDVATRMLTDIEKDVFRVLKLQQHITSYTGFVKAKRALRRSDTTAACHFLQSLSDSSITDPDIEFQTCTLSIELHLQTSSYSTALSKTEALLEKLQSQNADVFYITSAQLLKVHVLSRCGQAHRGLSLAMRAASVAFRSRIMPLVWKAMGAIAEILIEGEEFGAATQILQAIIPQAIEGGDIALCATLCALEADAWVGTAGREESMQNEQAQTRSLVRAEQCLEKALEYYAQVEDTQEHLQTLAKVAMIARLRGKDETTDTLALRYSAEKSFRLEEIWNGL